MTLEEVASYLRVSESDRIFVDILEMKRVKQFVNQQILSAHTLETHTVAAEAPV